jgi:hypothetical protein
LALAVASHLAGVELDENFYKISFRRGTNTRLNYVERVVQQQLNENSKSQIIIAKRVKSSFISVASFNLDSTAQQESNASKSTGVIGE